ncbi:HNH endonuclease domain-containing protein [Burkholderia anthina]|uniref:HNH endonuclease domain-containing protein n=1 Tax=Burkholderia anthina TaxID=179879 RepID=UPI00158B080C|nr:HNH endonuclease domain-containing protein [Burkholderia anthina]
MGTTISRPRTNVLAAEPRYIRDERHVHAWSNMLRSSKTSTLKYAVARAILDEAREAGDCVGELLISRTRLSSRLVSYYWYQVRQFRLKQAAAEIQEPNVVRRLRGMAESVDTKWDPLRPEVEDIVEFVTSAGFKEVIPRFHAGIEVKIFESREKGAIAIPAEQRAFLAVFEPLLTRSVLAGWAEQVEQYNHSPRALAKIRFDGRRRGGVSKWAASLRDLENACFYCHRTEPEAAHVDHVIPWSFLFDDAEWNLVLACGTCNSQKRDKVPAHRFLTRLCSRNADQVRLANSEFGKRIAFSLTQLTQHGIGGFEKTLDALCAQAYLQGFSRNWSPR